jgi:hypothetical protein
MENRSFWGRSHSFVGHYRAVPAGPANQLGQLDSGSSCSSDGKTLAAGDDKGNITLVGEKYRK